MNIEYFLKKYIHKETILYILFGILTTVVDWVVYRILRVAGMDKLPATCACWAAAVLFAFLTNKFWVFESRSTKFLLMLDEFIRFVLARISSLAINMFGIWIFSIVLSINEYIVKFFMAFVVIIMNYVISKRFIFKNEAGENNAQ